MKLLVFSFTSKFHGMLLQLPSGVFNTSAMETAYDYCLWVSNNYPSMDDNNVSKRWEKA